LAVETHFTAAATWIFVCPPRQKCVRQNLGAYRNVEAGKNLRTERKMGAGKNPCGRSLLPKKGTYISVCPVDMQSQLITST